MKKKILILLSMLTVMFSLSACDEKKDKPFEYDEASMVYNTMVLFEQYENVTESREEYYLSDGTDFEKSAVKGISQARDTDNVGKFEDFTTYLYQYTMTGTFDESLYDITNNTDTVTVTIRNHADNRDVDISVEYEENDQFYIEYDKLLYTQSSETVINYIYKYYGEEYVMNVLQTCESDAEILDLGIRLMLQNEEIYQYIPKEMVVSAVYSKSELMKNAGINTLIGMGTVFIVLIFISFIISLFKYLPKIFGKKEEKAKEEKKTPEPASPVVEDEEELVDDGELVAVITAALYASMEGDAAISKDKLVVRSIKRARR